MMSSKEKKGTEIELPFFFSRTEIILIMVIFHCGFVNPLFCSYSYASLHFK